MILDKIIRVKVNNRYLKKYEQLGYGKLKQGDFIDLPIEYLPKGSKTKVNSKCSYCDKISLIQYVYYNTYTKNGSKYCCLQCNPKKYKETCLKKYGVDNISKIPQTHDKIKSTNLEKYGVTSFTKLESFKEDHKKKMIDKYGVDSFSKTDEWLRKQKSTSLRKYGFENASQSPSVFSKQQRGRYEILQFQETNLYYQGSFELDFLEKYYYRLEIVKGISIEYNYRGNRKKYFSDFFLPYYNLVVEIKSTYTYNLAKYQNIEKCRECLSLGYEYIFIIDKNYDEFELILSRF